MASPSSSMLLGMTVGGATISGIGAASIYAMEKKKPTLKSILRDFIIGAVMVLMLLQILPDSTQSVLDSITGGVSSIVASASESVSSATSDMEIQVGVPRF